MRYAIVTSFRRGYAGLFLDMLRDGRGPAGAECVAVIVCEGRQSQSARRRRIARGIKKALRIGVIGTLNGFRMRRWYGADLEDRLRPPGIEDAASRAGIPVVRVPNFTADEAIAALERLDLDLAVSLGNGYIARKFFAVPRLGMLNIHHELLPEYRGAQAVLWQLHDGSARSGYTIHEITASIDAGRILYREEVPIEFGASLRETVVATSAAIQRRSLEGLVRVLGDLDRYRARARPNVADVSYTTPGLRALVRILQNHRRLRHDGRMGSGAVTA